MGLWCSLGHFSLTLRINFKHSYENGQLSFQGQLNLMFRVPLVSKQVFHFLRKDSLEPNSIDISLSLLKRETRFPLKLESSEVLS